MPRILPLLLVALAVTGCTHVKDETGVDESVDADGDGFAVGDECDDTNPAVWPGAPETCNGVDDDCDEEVDEEQRDTDGDGVCDGLDAEVCDGVDNDGDGLVDEDAGDADGDGLADCVDDETCDGVDNDGDLLADEGLPDADGDAICDGRDYEECDGLDNDGDGGVDEDFLDLDGDGTADCVDAEACDGFDNDGDGTVDEGYPDTDGDGRADCIDEEECDGLDNDGDGRVDEEYGDADADGTADCLDVEVCDGLDNDGDGLKDEGFEDTDGDGVSDCLDVEECDGLDNDGDGRVDEDWNDTDADGTADCLDVEECDGLDNDGNGVVDDGYPDVDLDGTANCVDVEACDGRDNDGDGDIDEGFGDADADGVCDGMDTEGCDGLDNDGDGLVDEGYADTDGDGIPDCLDAETCDGLDNDGDGLADEDFSDADSDGRADCVDLEECDGLDNDGDGLVDEGVGDDVDADGWSTCDGDCDDGDASAFPSSAEFADGVDNDCDGLVDEDFVVLGDVVVTEIMYDPDAVGDAEGEWFEVTNVSATDVRLDGWVISDGDAETFTVEDPLLVVAGSTVVLGANGTTSTNGGVVVDYVYSRGDFQLGNGADGVVALFGGESSDAVMYDISGGWPVGTGHSLALDPYFIDATWNDDPGNWCLATTALSGGDYGTPGAGNELCGQFDHDGDGWTGDDGDCDDENEATWPGAPNTEPGVDNDCDGIIGNTAPVAVADLADTAPVSTCSTLWLDGTGSYDLDGDPIVAYAWTVEAAPLGSVLSTLDIDEETEPLPTFVPDQEGVFTFGLVVSDGADWSPMDVVDVEVTSRGYNTAPTASAGIDAAFTDAVTCTEGGYTTTCDACSTVVFALNGGGSSDPDGDALLYQWTVVSGGSHASLTGADSATPSLVVSGVSTDLGVTTVETIEVELEVRDCEGESDVDSVVLTYSCTGS